MKMLLMVGEQERQAPFLGNNVNRAWRRAGSCAQTFGLMRMAPLFFCQRTGEEEGGDRLVGTGSPTQAGGEARRLIRDAARLHRGEHKSAGRNFPLNFVYKTLDCFIKRLYNYV
jgi:hypothetical protein